MLSLQPICLVRTATPPLASSPPRKGKTAARNAVRSGYHGVHSPTVKAADPYTRSADPFHRVPAAAHINILPDELKLPPAADRPVHPTLNGPAAGAVSHSTEPVDHGSHLLLTANRAILVHAQATVQYEQVFPERDILVFSPPTLLAQLPILYCSLPSRSVYC